MASLIDTMKQRWHRHRQQARLQIIKGELENAQRDCAQLGAYIGELVRRKSELEIEIHRETA